MATRLSRGQRRQQGRAHRALTLEFWLEEGAAAMKASRFTDAQKASIS